MITRPSFLRKFNWSKSRMDVPSLTSLMTTSRVCSSLKLRSPHQKATSKLSARSWYFFLIGRLLGKLSIALIFFKSFSRSRTFSWNHQNLFSQHQNFRILHYLMGSQMGVDKKEWGSKDHKCNCNCSLSFESCSRPKKRCIWKAIIKRLTNLKLS